MIARCRDCAELIPAAPHAIEIRCPACGSPRIFRHAELDSLSIAHIDCDAFYASVEKRDNPDIADRAVIVGGGKRGVVSACCYVARIYGVRSAMPMFKALKACPDAVVIHPDMAKYQRVGRQVRSLMIATTPLVEPLSIDEAFLDLAGTEKLHGGSPSRTLMLLARRIEQEIGITVSIGLSYNKFLAKVASDLDKPRGFSAIGRADAIDFLRTRPVSLIWGVGPALMRRLNADGITTLGQLQTRDERELTGHYGAIGKRLARFARGIDDRSVDPDGPTKSISAETTFDADVSASTALAQQLWPLCEKVAERLKRHKLAGRSVTLKLKTADFRVITRSRSLGAPTQLAETLYQTALPLLEAEAQGRKYRLIGIGAAEFGDLSEADPPDLFDRKSHRVADVERAIDNVRAKLGDDAIMKGRALEPRQRRAR
ncbi:MAG: DNA polymerase IV [Alphaproteobacteria bacterium]|nr:DNA polymerase IV [Alphaproteobacteria bacterium]